MISTRILPIITLAILLFGCTGEVSENRINNEFYGELYEHVNSDHFSPMSFAGQNKPVPVDFQIEIEDSTLLVSGPAGHTRIEFAPIAVSYSHEDNQVRTGYTVMVYYSNGKKSVIDEIRNPTREEMSIHFSTSDQNISILLEPYNDYLKWKVLPTEKELIDSILIKGATPGPFYGGGERFLSTCLNGRTISNQTNDHFFDPPWDEVATWGRKHEPGYYERYEPSYLQIPYFLSSSGLAWYIDDASSVFMTFPESGNQFSVRIENNQTEFYTIQRSTPKEALETYTSLVGRQPELPDWAVGVWTNLLEGRDSVFAKANRLKEWNVPVTVIWLIDMYDIESSQGWQFRGWSAGVYGDLSEVTDSLHSLGFKVLSYFHPYQEEKMPRTHNDNPMYHKLDSMGLLLKTTDQYRNSRYRYPASGQYDFHNPLMGEIWQGMIQKVLIRDNFDGYMEDFGDILYLFDLELNKWFTIDYGIETLLTPHQYANSYPLIYHKLTYLNANAIKKDMVSFCRSGSAGSAPYTQILWGGDQLASWNKEFGYPSAITSGISSGLSGYGNWAPDVLCNSPSTELWKRWVQFSAFTPIFRDHLWKNAPTSIDLWTSPETRAYFKRYAEIHMELVPYIQESLAEYRETGTPMIRHMMLEFPEDSEGYYCEYQYMFGPKYLVAPVVEKSDRTKKIYFPEGTWKSYWDLDTIHSTGEWITVPAPLDLIPVYERME